jgi:transposase-like protein
MVGGRAMADETYAEMTVECPICQTAQRIHVSVSTGGGQVGAQSMACLNCNSYFNVTVPDSVVDGPFPA